MDSVDLLETAALAVVLAVAGLPLLRWRSGLRLYLVLLGLLVAGAAVVSATRPPRLDERDVVGRPAELPGDGYVSSDACRSCHPREYETWRASFHRTMTQVASPATAAAPFDGVPIEVGGRVYRPFQRNGRLWIEMDDSYGRGVGAGARIERPISLTTGSHHQQDYWIETGPGRAVAHLPIVYRIEEQRWLPNGSTFLKPPDEAGSLASPEVGGWNRNCIQCHATAGRPLMDLPRDVQTRVAELGIACEACHGPGAEHVVANRDPVRRHNLQADDTLHDDTIVNPARLDAARSVEVCGQCHMVSTVMGPASAPEWNLRGATYRPGDVLAETRDVLRPATRPDDPILQARMAANPRFLRNRFWSDGMLRVTGRELHGLLDSPCSQGGAFDCLTCHRLHPDEDDPRPLAGWADDQLHAEARDGRICAGCHAEIAAAPDEHTHHERDSSGSDCLNCHMPHTSYGLLKAIRSHQISAPDVATTIATGRPNACNLCHLDRPLAWTARHLEDWYGQAPVALPAREEALASSVLWLLTGDAGQRALMAWHMGSPTAIEASGGSDWMQPLLAHLLDAPYDAIRFLAERSLEGIDGRRDVEQGAAYDFMTTPERRRAIRASLLDRLAARSVPRPDGATLLRDASGRLDRARLQELARERNDQPLELWE